MKHEIGTVFVGPKSSVGWEVNHWAHGTGMVVGLHDLAIVKFQVKTLAFVTATANQQPKLIKTGSEQGKTCLANVKVKGLEVINKDDGKLIGWVKQNYDTGVWYWVHNVPDKLSTSGFQTKHQAVKGLVGWYNQSAGLTPGDYDVTYAGTAQKHGKQNNPWALNLPPKTADGIVNSLLGTFNPAPAVPASISEVIDHEHVKQQVAGGDEAWKSVKQELDPNTLVGANPVKGKSGAIVGGEIHFNGIKLGYTVSNGNGTMKVYHCDGTLVVDAAVPGKGHATNGIAAHHTERYSGQAELIAELTAKIKNIIDGDKIKPSERSLLEGGLHNQPHLAYAAPAHERVIKHFKDDDSSKDGALTYGLVHGAHLLSLTTAEKNALNYYTHNGFAIMNAALRANAVSSVAMMNRIKAMDAIFLKTLELEEAITIFRGIDSGTAVKLLGSCGEKVGKTFLEPGFSSCSAYVSSAFTSGSNIIMRITVPRGSHVVKPSKAGHYGDQESEIILPREAELLVFRDEMVQAGPYQKRQVDLVFTGSLIN